MTTILLSAVVPNPFKSSVKSDVPLKFWRPYTPAIFRIASLTLLTLASRICSAVITVAPIGASVDSNREAETVTGASFCPVSTCATAGKLKVASAETSASGFHAAVLRCDGRDFIFTLFNG